MFVLLDNSRLDCFLLRVVGRDNLRRSSETARATHTHQKKNRTMVARRRKRAPSPHAAAGRIDTKRRTETFPDGALATRSADFRAAR